MNEPDLHELVGKAIDGCLGWGSTVVTAATHVPPKIRSLNLWAGPGIRALRLQREGYGLGLERQTMLANVVVDATSPPDDIVVTTVRQCRALIGVQTELRSRAQCAGIKAPLEREQFVDLGRLCIDIAAAYALRNELGSDAAVRGWLRGRLGTLFDEGPATCFAVRGFTVEVPFKVDPLAPAVGRIAPNEDFWSGSIVRLTLPQASTRSDAVASFEQVLQMMPLGDRPIVDLMPWPDPNMVRFIERLGRTRDGVRCCRPWRYQHASAWQALVEERLVGVDEAFG